MVQEESNTQGKRKIRYRSRLHLLVVPSFETREDDLVINSPGSLRLCSGNKDDHIALIEKQINEWKK